MRPAPNRPDADALPELRRLLLGRRRADVLDDLADGLRDQDAEAVSNVLPDAVRLRSKRDNDLGDALAPAIEEGLTSSVQRNPKPVADAIFPIIFPAIRRAIQHAMASSLQSINTTLNYGLSFRALKWRAEAWRSGVSFPEVVLKHTLQYRVEQVLLVHRESGLLLEHVVAPEIQSTDGDLVSAMLTAIRQFVEDSFDVDDDEALDAIQVGDLTVWVEPGPHAVVATVIRGTPPTSLRDVMIEVIETVHRRHGSELKGFKGDATLFEPTRPILERCLESEYVEDSDKMSPMMWMILLLVVFAIGWLIFSSVRTAQRDGEYVDALDAAPGIEVIEAERSGGQLHVAGLRDPLSVDPQSLIEASGLDAGDVSGDWAPFVSMESVITGRRAEQMLDAPDGVTLAVDSLGVLRGEGLSDERWRREANRLAAFVPGVTEVDLSGVWTILEAANERLEAHAFQMEENATVLLPGQESAVRAVVDEAILLAEGAAEVSGQVILEVIGHTDAIGTTDANMALSRRRAQSVYALLPQEVFTVPNLSVRIIGRGAMDRLADGEHPPSRRVTFRVQIPEPEEEL